MHSVCTLFVPVNIEPRPIINGISVDLDRTCHSNAGLTTAININTRNVIKPTAMCQEIMAQPQIKTQYLYVPYPSEHKTFLYNICTMLNQRRRRWADVVQILYKCFVFAGIVQM